MSRPLTLVFLGLTLSSSWGNGHATTYRCLLRGLAGLGHRCIFLERDMPWYAAHRDLAEPDFCTLHAYASLTELRSRFGSLIKDADAVVVGSYVPEGIAAIEMVAGLAQGALCFYDIDTPVTLARLREGRAEYIARAQIPLFDIYFSFSGGPILRRFETEFGARRAQALPCAADPSGHAVTAEPARWDLGYLGTYSADRQAALEALLIEPARRLPDRRFVVAGPQFPDSIAWPANVERIEHVPPAEHAAFYGRQRYTLNITRADMVAAGHAPSVRLFEAAACGTPVISDRWAGLDTFFTPGRSIHAVSGAAEVVGILTGETETARLEMAGRARAAVLARHTGARRAAEFLEAVRGRRGMGHAAGAAVSASQTVMIAE